jgi:hypothetical protein
VLKVWKTIPSSTAPRVKWGFCPVGGGGLVK